MTTSEDHTTAILRTEEARVQLGRSPGATTTVRRSRMIKIRLEPAPGRRRPGDGGASLMGGVPYSLRVARAGQAPRKIEGLRTNEAGMVLVPESLLPRTETDGMAELHIFDSIIRLVRLDIAPMPTSNLPAPLPPRRTSPAGTTFPPRPNPAQPQQVAAWRAALAATRTRLFNLGYMTGYLLASPSEPSFDTSADSSAFQQAVLNFQSDHSIDADADPQTIFAELARILPD